MPGITTSTRILGLLGHPVSHSRSPELHNAALRALGLPYVYLAFDVLPGRVGEALAGLRALGARGVNVTIPHKEAVLAFANVLSPEVVGTGAANTLVFEENQTVAYNTDIDGFWAGLEPQSSRCQGCAAVVLGGGGAARAAAWALLKYLHPTQLTFAVRTPSRTERLLHDLKPYAGGCSLNVASISESREFVQNASIIVNTTPVGMFPKVDETPYPFPEDFHAGHIVYDLIYRPAPTLLLREAALRGATCIDGLPMFVGQASAAFSFWTQTTLPTAVVETFMARLAA
jgi:shikimate dehydrogenase